MSLPSVRAAATDGAQGGWLAKAYQFAGPMNTVS